MTLRRISGPDWDIYIGCYAPGVLQNPPWGQEPFDCFVVRRSSGFQTKDMALLAEELASANTDWVETIGTDAERLHDAIDSASVQIGRQRRVGDGSPMTAWHDRLLSTPAIIEHVRVGGLGQRSTKVLLVIGTEADAAELVRALEDALREMPED